MAEGIAYVLQDWYGFELCMLSQHIVHMYDSADILSIAHQAQTIVENRMKYLVNVRSGHPRRLEVEVESSRVKVCFEIGVEICKW